MFNYLKKLHRDESGITALETAIILIAFIVVASVFAFTILSAGTFSTQKGKEAVYGGLQEVQSSMEIKGSVIANATVGYSGTITNVVFTVGNVVGGQPIDLSTGANQVVTINYRDSTQFKNNLTWSLAWITRHDQDNLLDSGELAEITVDLTGLTTQLGPNTNFNLEIKPPMGATISIERTTPPYFDPVVTLQ